MSPSLADRFGNITHTSSRPAASAEQAAGGAAGSGATRFDFGREGQRGIRILDSFDEEFTLGKEVMPSTHSNMEVRFATRNSDKVKAVVKLRLKPKCFRSLDDERTWRHNTEFLLNMPDVPGICRLHDVIEDSKAFYIVMEKVGGMDLFETLDSEGAASPSSAQEVLRQLLTSVAHLHRHNMVHKDLKLENVMLDSSKGTKSVSASAVKVIDFDTVEEWSPCAKVAKDVVGTDQYISPEAYAGKYSPLSDIFAVGVVAYRLLTGKFPYVDDMFDDEAGENWVGSPKMAQIRRRLKAFRVDYSHQAFVQNPLACDLVMRMLSSSELLRPSAAAALQHPWLKEDFEGSRSRLATGPRPEEELLDDGIIIADE